MTHRRRLIRSQASALGLVMVALVLALSVGGCGLLGTDDTPSAVDASGHEPSTESSSSDIVTGSPTSTVTEVSGDGESDAGSDDTGEGAIAVPSPSSMPNERNVDEISAALWEAISERGISASSIDNIELLGNGTAPSQQTPGIEDMWASYLVHLAGGTDLGVRVTCSSEMEPYATVTDLLTVNSDGQVYDVNKGIYLNYTIGNGDETAPPVYEVPGF